MLSDHYMYAISSFYKLSVAIQLVNCLLITSVSVASRYCHTLA